MGRRVFTHTLIAILTSLMSLISLTILGTGIWLATRSASTECMRFLQWPLIALGLLLLLVSLLGLWGSLTHNTALLRSYCASLLLLTFLVVFFLIFAYNNVSSSGAPPPTHVPNAASVFKSYAQFRLGNYYSWLQLQLYKEPVWHKISSCIADSHTCRNMAASELQFKSLQLSSFNNNDNTAHISPIQSGCCMPPPVCGFTLGTNNNNNNNNTISPAPDADCGLWRDNPLELCYSCNSCKIGVLQRVKKDSHKIAVISVVFVVFIFIVHFVSCCAVPACRCKLKPPRVCV